MLFWISRGSEVTSHFPGTTAEHCVIFVKKREGLSRQSGTRPGQVACPSHTHYSLTHSQFRVSSQAVGGIVETREKVLLLPVPGDYSKVIV